MHVSVFALKVFILANIIIRNNLSLMGTLT